MMFSQISNALKAGLCLLPEDYFYSSASYYYGLAVITPITRKTLTGFKTLSALNYLISKLFESNGFKFTVKLPPLC